MCYFFYSLICFNYFHTYKYRKRDKSYFYTINKGTRVGFKDMKRIRRLKRAKYKYLS